MSSWLIPARSASHANDWVALAGSNHFRWAASSRDNQRSVPVHIAISSDSGSGSNTWTVEPKLLPLSEQDREDWRLFPLPHHRYEHLHRFTFDETDLPVNELVYWPYWLHPLAFLFTRTGAGTNKLQVDYQIAQS